MAVAAFAKTLSESRDIGPRLLVPEAPEAAFCAVGLPIVLRAEVRTAPGTVVAETALRPLLPPILRELLGNQTWDSAPWGRAVVRAIRVATEEVEEGSSTHLNVTAALAATPAVQDGLFEVTSPIGPVTLRIKEVRDTLQVEHASLDEHKNIDDKELVATVLLPSQCLDSSLLQAAWKRNLLPLTADAQPEAAPGDSSEADEDNGSSSSSSCCNVRSSSSRSSGSSSSSASASSSMMAWCQWFSQWGTLSHLDLTVHVEDSIALESSGSSALFAATFTDAQSCTLFVKSLRGRLLVFKGAGSDADERAAFPEVRLMSRSAFQAQAEQAWEKHRALQQEIEEIDRQLVRDAMRDGVPAGAESAYAPLLELCTRWLETGSLLATCTVCAQGRFWEEERAGTCKTVDLFRRVCWYGAFRVVLEVQPTTDKTEMAFAVALCQHWRKAYGICLNLDSDELLELAAVIDEVCTSSRSQEDALREALEAKSLTAERELLKDLEAEQLRCERDKKRKAHRRQREKQRRREKADGAISVSTEIDDCLGRCLQQAEERHRLAIRLQPVAPPTVALPDLTQLQDADAASVVAVSEVVMSDVQKDEGHVEATVSNVDTEMCPTSAPATTATSRSLEEEDLETTATKKEDKEDEAAELHRKRSYSVDSTASTRAGGEAGAQERSSSIDRRPHDADGCNTSDCLELGSKAEVASSSGPVSDILEERQQPCGGRVAESWADISSAALAGSSSSSSLAPQCGAPDEVDVAGCGGAEGDGDEGAEFVRLPRKAARRRHRKRLVNERKAMLEGMSGSPPHCADGGANSTYALSTGSYVNRGSGAVWKDSATSPHLLATSPRKSGGVRKVVTCSDLGLDLSWKQQSSDGQAPLEGGKAQQLPQTPVQHVSRPSPQTSPTHPARLISCFASEIYAPETQHPPPSYSTYECQSWPCSPTKQAYLSRDQQQQQQQPQPPPDLASPVKSSVPAPALLSPSAYPVVAPAIGVQCLATTTVPAASTVPPSPDNSSSSNQRLHSWLHAGGLPSCAEMAEHLRAAAPSTYED